LLSALWLGIRKWQLGHGHRFGKWVRKWIGQRQWIRFRLRVWVWKWQRQWPRFRIWQRIGLRFRQWFGFR
jgi:hypothetical protein